MPKLNNIAIIGKRDSAHLVEYVTRMAECLQNIGCKVYIDDSVATNISCQNAVCGSFKDWVNEIDLALIIGGDGTMLSAGRKIVDHGIPIVGINQGKLGFMTDIAVDEMIITVIKMILNAEYVEEDRTLLTAQVFRAGNLVNQSLALNDIVISRGVTGSMIEFDLSINAEFVHTQKSDGIIFSTPTGSTAYSLAAGGPILHPHCKVFSIVPICPQSMSNRPIVISDDMIIELTIIKDSTTILHYDGQEYFDLKNNDRIIICKAKRPLRLLHPMSYNYYHTLRTKLDWAKRVS